MPQEFDRPVRSWDGIALARICRRADAEPIYLQT